MLRSGRASDRGLQRAWGKGRSPGNGVTRNAQSSLTAPRQLPPSGGHSGSLSPRGFSNGCREVLPVAAGVRAREFRALLIHSASVIDAVWPRAARPNRPAQNQSRHDQGRHRLRVTSLWSTNEFRIITALRCPRLAQRSSILLAALDATAVAIPAAPPGKPPRL